MKVIELHIVHIMDGAHGVTWSLSGEGGGCDDIFIKYQ